MRKEKSMTIHYTTIGTIQYMSIANPTKDGKYTIKLQIDGNTPEGGLLREQLKSINPKKIVTSDSDGNLVGPTGKHFNVTFSSNYPPSLVLGPNNEELTGDEIPHFDSRTDSGIAAVGFSVKEKDGQQFTNLKSVKLVSLDQAPRQDYTEVLDQMREKLQAISNG